MSPRQASYIDLPDRGQDEETLKSIEEFRIAIEKSYKNGKPLHISDPENSVFHIVSESVFKTLTDAQVQEILRTQHIVVTDTVKHNLNFKQALKRLAPLSSTVTIQGEFLRLSVVLRLMLLAKINLSLSKVTRVPVSGRARWPSSLNPLSRRMARY